MESGLNKLVLDRISENEIYFSSSEFTKRNDHMNTLFWYEQDCVVLIAKIMPVQTIITQEQDCQTVHFLLE